MNHEAIRNALSVLDVEDASHWTSDGLPRVEVVANLINEPELKRADITRAAPRFIRQSPILGESEGEASPSMNQIAADPDPEPESEVPLEDQLKANEMEIAHCQAEMDAARARLQQAQRRRAEIRQRMHQRPTHLENMEGIQRYLRGQHQARAKRAQSMRVLAEAGLPPQALSALKAATMPQIDPNRKAREMLARERKKG